MELANQVFWIFYQLLPSAGELFVLAILSRPSMTFITRQKRGLYRHLILKFLAGNEDIAHS